MVCADSIAAELRAMGEVVIEFEDSNAVPSDVDVLWDPRAGGGNPPISGLCNTGIPLVVTLHGVAPMAIPLSEYYKSWRQRYRGWLANRRKVVSWRSLDGQYSAVVTVSSSSRTSILENLPIDPSLLSWCHNAVNHSKFIPNVAAKQSGYLLHISNDEPRKNVDRICDAYQMLPKLGRPRLLLKLPSDTHRQSGDGIVVIHERLSEEALLDLYQNALAFIFPSLFEGFGLPIIEAMASGCPVITSDTHACAEVAGNAALLVNPNATAPLLAAMESIIESEATRDTLRSLGLERAQYFHWSNAAKHYLSVFQSVLTQPKA
ncbi:MAG: glycosyltransferase involved in cell wall biosynthesis [Congregibacter sp.]|jgi:glycosyltransferase involved in cell wall biosynthesis